MTALSQFLAEPAWCQCFYSTLCIDGIFIRTGCSRTFPFHIMNLNVTQTEDCVNSECCSECIILLVSVLTAEQRHA